MPAFDLRGIKIATYTNTNGTVSYSNRQTIGDAMNCNVQVKSAEGRVYAEGTLAEYMTKITGGTISIGVKYIPDAAQKVLFGTADKTRSITVGGTTTSVTGLQTTSTTVPNYVGAAFYAPSMRDGVKKYECVFISKCLFGQPSLSYQTAGDNITFQTPTTTGEFLADDSAAEAMTEYALVDSVEIAEAWITACLT